MHNLRLFACVALVLTTSFARGQGAATAPAPIVIENGVAVKMRDGITLRADVFRPSDEAKHPVLLVRSPYNRVWEGGTCRRAVERGFVCIAVDVRGRFGSEGEWYTFVNELNDGYDTVEWAAALPNSNGKVAMFGGSYVGATQWLAALTRPPHLLAIQPTYTASNYHEGWVYQGGALEQWFVQSWSSGLSMDTLGRAVKKAIGPEMQAKHLPLKDFPGIPSAVPRDVVPYYHDWVANPAYGPFWKRWAIDENYASLPVASLNIGGWYDIFLTGTLKNYVGMRAKAATPWARENTRLIVGPWFHGPMDGKAGQIDFGKESIVDTTGAMLDWYEGLLLGKARPAGQKPVRIWVMGINQWRDEDDWPLARARNTRYYLHSGGKANTASGDGALTMDQSSARAHDSYTYDPANPVPTTGGNLCCENDVIPSGGFDQREIEKREDVLVYTGPALQQDIEVTGPLSMELYVSSSAVDTDFTAKLVDVHPDGYAQNLADGIQRMRYAASPEQAQLIEPGKIYKVTIDLGATSNVFRAGHRIRVEVSSSNYPRFSRNLNTAESPESGTSFVKAQNRIYHDAEHPSAIVLPVVP